MRRASAIIIVALALAACSGAENKLKPLSEAGEKLYTLKGHIVARYAPDNTIRLDHEAIPGFMEAMTMDYSVRGANVTALPADNVPVEAKLHVTSNAYWLTDVKKAP